MLYKSKEQLSPNRTWQLIKVLYYLPLKILLILYSPPSLGLLTHVYNNVYRVRGSRLNLVV
jgi:hypothetical protein